MTNALVSTTSSSSSTASSNVLRITGMASGIDTDAVVKSMVSSYQAKIDKANQAKQTLQWQQDAYRNIITGIKGLQEYFDPLSSKYMLSSSSFDTNTAKSDTPSVVSATASSSAKTGTYAVNVTQLATQANIQGSSKDSLVTVTDLSKWSGNELDFGTNGNINLSSIAAGTNISDTSMSNLAADINKQISASTTLNGKISASYVSDGGTSYIKFASTADGITLNGQNTTGSKTTISDITSDLSINSGISSSSLLTSLGFAAGNIGFTLANGTTSSQVSLTVGSASTVNDLMNAVNSATSGAVTMNIDDTTGKISFQSKSYGSASNITITDANTSNNVITNLGISTTTGKGTDAIVSITAPGQSAVTTTQSSNEFTENGVTYNLVNKGPANVTVTSNTDSVVANIKSFVTDYNTIISTINTKLTEKKDSAYPPLTDAQKASMTADQITAWNTKAQVGILRNDDNLQSLLTQLRGTLSPVYSSYSSASPSTGKISLSFGSYGTSSVGLDTSTDYTDGGKLVITDATKLADALTNNPDDFKKLFIGTSATTLDPTKSYVGSQTYQEDGILTRMSNLINTYVGNPGIGTDGTSTLSGSMNIFVNKQYDYSSTGFSGKNTLPDQVYNQTLNITKLQTQMSDAETRYYNQFSALESAMSTLNSQQSTLTSMLG